MKEQEKIKRRLRTVSAKVKDNSDLADKNRADNYFDHTFLLRYYSNWVNINGRVKNAAVECIEHIVLDFVAQAYLTLLEFPSFKALGVGAMKMPKHDDGDDRRMSSELTKNSTKTIMQRDAKKDPATNAYKFLGENDVSKQNLYFTYFNCKFATFNSFSFRNMKFRFQSMTNF